MFKKAIIISSAILLIVTGAAFACDGPNCYAEGNFDIHTSATGAGYDVDGAILPAWSGGTFGISGAIGSAGANASGHVNDGSTSGAIGTTGGGLSNTESYVFHPLIGDLSIGIGSASSNYAVAGASVDVTADPDALFGFAAARGCLHGFAAQGSLDVSGVGESPLPGWNTEGGSGGVAMQGSLGGFSGHVCASDFGELPWYDSYANAGASAYMEMWGRSYSESYRWMENNSGGHTEGMGTYVGANTTVNTSGDDYSYEHGCLNHAGADVHGGYLAGGLVMANTHQSYEGEQGMGEANASATGSYSGAGVLNCNYTGAAYGGTQTQITTVNGMNGSIVTSNAAMHVTSETSRSQYQAD